jgi:hypothetical protein
VHRLREVVAQALSLPHGEAGIAFTGTAWRWPTRASRANFVLDLLRTHVLGRARVFGDELVDHVVRAGLLDVEHVVRDAQLVRHPTPSTIRANAEIFDRAVARTLCPSAPSAVGRLNLYYEFILAVVCRRLRVGRRAEAREVG